MINVETLLYIWSVCLSLNALNLFTLDLFLNRYYNKKIKYSLVSYFNLAPKETPSNRKYIINIIGYTLAPLTFVITGVMTTFALPAISVKFFYNLIKDQIIEIRKLRGKNEKK